MFKKSLVCSMIAGALSAAPALAPASDDVPTLAAFTGGIGVLGSPSGSVRGVAPAGAIWAIDSLGAKVRTNGHIPCPDFTIRCCPRVIDIRQRSGRQIYFLKASLSWTNRILRHQQE